ncbi:MAG: BPL-N domain-containing protein, partial [Planctomycetota bacterium]|nr:BPL-N domain-containing protein [Planctomycetota bacterium]
QQRSMIWALLKHLELIDPSLDVDLLAGRGSAPDKTWVALYDAGGTGGKGGTAVELVLARAGMQVVHLGPDEIAAGTLSQFHLAIVPGGSGSREAKAMGEQGRRQMKQFVEHGGGYLGICAGAYLCTSGFEWGLKILKAKTVSPRWQRGAGMVKMELTSAGRRILGDRTGLLDVRYANGPVITRANDESLPDYEVLACFRTELSNNGTSPGEMLNSPAIATGKCGRGRVVFISPHPEQTPGLEDFIRRAALWAAGGEGMVGPDP